MEYVSSSAYCTTRNFVIYTGQHCKASEPKEAMMGLSCR